MTAKISNLSSEQKWTEMGLVQASSFSALFCWYPAYARKLDQQMHAIKEKTSIVSTNHWKGIGRQMFFQPLFPFVFGVKEQILLCLAERKKSSVTSGDIVLSASLAGALTGPYANAVEVCVIRRRVHPNESWYQALRQIWHRSGPGAFFKGTALMSLRNMKFGGVLAGVNPVVKEQLDKKLTLQNPTPVKEVGKTLAVNIGSAVPSALLASVLTMPYDNIAVRRQTNAVGLDQSGSNLEAIRKIYSQHGWRGFFIGTKLRCRQAKAEFVAFNLFLTLYSYLAKKSWKAGLTTRET